MKTIKIPTWLSKILTETGLDHASYTFSLPANDLIETITAAGLPDEFIGIAEGDEGKALVVAKKYDGIIYRFDGNDVNVFAMNETEFSIAIRREEAWEELSENMPAAHAYWLGIILKTKAADGSPMTLGFPHLQRASVMVIRGRIEADDILADALTRELKEALEINDYKVIDLVDEGGVLTENGLEEPMFNVIVEVEHFDPMQKIGDPQIGWVKEEPSLLN